MARILVDANILLRYLVDGDDLLVRTSKIDEVWLVDEVVIELVFALEHHYKLTREQVFSLVTELLMKPNCYCEREILFDSLIIYKKQNNLSIVDAYLIIRSKKSKVKLLSYDEKIKKTAEH